jgi:hypothetical protein
VPETGPATVLRVSAVDVNMDRDRRELQRIFGRQVELIPYRGRDLTSIVERAREVAADAIEVTHFRERVELAREAAPIPVVCAVWREEETTNRFGFRTTERRWDGLGQVSERGEVQRLADGALSAGREENPT